MLKSHVLDLTEDILIKSFFSKEDWDEINESFKRDVKLVESNMLNIVEYFFDEVKE
ncbi:7765_t:CDS:2, partial [Entrophospora sp. SA101]